MNSRLSEASIDRYPQRIIVATSKVPLISGVNVLTSRRLVAELARRGHHVEATMLPVHPNWSEMPMQLLGIRALDLLEFGFGRIDLLIALDYPAYALRHPNKIVWLQHGLEEPHRFWGLLPQSMPVSPQGQHIRTMLAHHQALYLAEAQRVHPISQAIAAEIGALDRIRVGEQLYPPFDVSTPSNLVMNAVVCILPMRESLLRAAVEAMNSIDPSIRLVCLFTGVDEIQHMFSQYRSDNRFEFCTNDDPVGRGALMAQAFVCIADSDNPSYDVLELFAYGIPVLSLKSTELLRDDVNGFVVEPDSRSLAYYVNKLWTDLHLRNRLSESARDTCRLYSKDWNYVVNRLLQ
jgi:glycosyltransferase involved in cell wall biosynthesis